MATPSCLRLRIGEWQAEHASGELTGPSGSERLEPKVMDLLFLLAQHPGEVVAREQILQSLWRGLIVGDDTLARTVSKLRRALGDDARTPQYIETHSKRGYRLIAPVTVLAVSSPAVPEVRLAEAAIPMAADGTTRRRRIAGWGVAAGLILAIAVVVLWRPSAPKLVAGDADTVDLVAHADDFYFQYSRADNEAAIALYQRVLALHPDHAPALAGLANALVQKLIRWPTDARAGGREFTRLGDALQLGHLEGADAVRQLERAQQLAERAVALAPKLAASHKALGFVRSAQTQFDVALASYREALRLDPDAWGPLINIGDVLEIQGHGAEALPHFEAAYAAMTRMYPSETARIRPWHAELGVGIGDRYRARGDLGSAEAWYRRVLGYAPLHPGATRGLAALLRASGDRDEAKRLCAELVARIGTHAGCTPAR